MTKLKIVLMGILVVVIIIFVSTFVWFLRNGKSFVESQIEENLNAKVSTGSIRVDLPLTVTVDNLEVGDLLKAKRISFSPDIIGFLFGKVVLSGLTVYEPQIYLVQSEDGSLNIPEPKKQAKTSPIYLLGLTVKNGKFTYVDKKLRPEGFLTILDNIEVRIAKVMFPPTSLNTKFNLSGRFVDSDSKELGKIDFSGWIDFWPKDMDGALLLKNLDAAYFNPYYGDFISKRKMLSAKLNITSLMKAKNNDLKIATSLLLSDMVYEETAQPQEGEAPTVDLGKSTLDLFTDKQGNLILDFVLNTKLDNPAISQNMLKKAILNAAFKNLANQSPQDLIEKVTGNIKNFEEFGKQMKELFKKKKE